METSDSDSRSKIETRQFTFAELPDYSELVNSKPTRFKTPQGSYDVNSWRKIYRHFCVYVMNVKPRHLKALKNLEETFLGRRVMFSNNIGDLIDPFKLSVSFYAELNLSAKSIIHNIIHIIQFCRLSPRQFAVSIPVYVEESELAPSEVIEDEQNEASSQLAQPEQSLSQFAHFTLDDDIPDLAFSKPVSITINTRRYSVSKWRDIVSETARYVYENDAESFLRYLYKNFGPKGNSRPLFSDKSSNLLQASRIDSNLYVETNFSSVDCVKKALLFIRYANIPQSKVQIEYLPAGAVNSNNLIPAESANINTEPEEELEDSAVVESNTSEQSQTEPASIESKEDNDIPRTDDNKPEEFKDDKEWDFSNDKDDFVDIGMEFTDDGLPVLTPGHQMLIDAIEEKFPKGIDIDNEDSVRTLELASGIPCNKYTIEDLRMILAYNKADNVFYVPLRLADESTVKLMAAFIDQNVDQYKAVSLSVIREKFQDQFECECNDEELLEFIEWYVYREMDQVVAIDYSDVDGDGVCLPRSITTDEFCENFYGQIESYLEKADSPVPMSQLRQLYPSLNETIISYALSDDRFGSSIQEETKDEQLFYSIRSDSQLNDEATDEQEPEPECEILSFTLDAPIPNLRFSKPVAMTIGDNRIELNLWREAITKTAEYLSENEPISFNSLIEEYGVKSKNRTLFSRNRSDILQPCKFNSELWVETKFEATDCVKKAKLFLGFCYIEPSQVRIEYIPSSANRSVRAQKIKAVNNNRSAGAPAQQQTLAELTKNPPELTPELQKLLQIIQENFPQGVQLEISKNILENASGVQCTDEIVDDLKWFLFESVNVNGLFYLPSQIADESTLNDMAEFIDQQIKQHGAAATSVVREKFRYRLKFIISEDNEDLANFIDKQINPRLEQKVQIVYKENRKSKEKSKYSICLSESTSEKQFDKDVSLQIKQYLQERNCAAPMYELCNQFPHLDEAVLAYYLDEDENELLDDVFRVNYDGDEVSYYRTIDSLYLEDDFSEALTQAVAQLESNGGTATLATIGAKLDEYYNLESEDGRSAFREQYELTDDAAFRYVVQRCYAGEINHKWGTKTRFVPETYTGSLNLYDEFKKLYPNCGVFYENKFFDFAERFGVTNKYILFFTWLYPYFIRINKDNWISIEEFNRKASFDSTIKDIVKNKVLEELGVKPFYSITLISQSISDGLPVINIDGQNYYWNEYMLTSIVRHFIPEIRIENDNLSQSSVTVQVIPKDAKFGDFLDYVLENYKKTGYRPSSIDEVFNYLRQNYVRLQLRGKLIEKIKDFMGNYNV